MERVILLHAAPYDFVTAAGDKLSGLKLQYITDYIEATERSKGCPIMMATAPIDASSSLAAVPGVYDVEFRMRPGKDNKPTLTPVSLSFAAPWTPGTGLLGSDENTSTRSGTNGSKSPAQTAPVASELVAK